MAEITSKRSLAEAEWNARYLVQEAYSAVEGRRHTDSVSSLTLGDLAQARIDEISKDASAVRPSKISEVQRIEREIKLAVKYLKTTQPKQFDPKLRAKKDGSVNTEATKKE